MSEEILDIEVDVFAVVHRTEAQIVPASRMINHIPYDITEEELRKIVLDSDILVQTGAGEWIGTVAPDDFELGYRDALGEYKVVFPYSEECRRCGDSIPPKEKAYQKNTLTDRFYCCDCYSLIVVADI